MTQKHYVPLECNPEVFNELIHSLGVSEAVGFHDVWSLDEPEMLAMIPRPCYALILAFPISATYEQYRKNADKELDDGYYNDISGTDKEQQLWFKQTIGNACGTMAALHATANSIPKDLIVQGSAIDRFFNSAKSLNVTNRAKLLEDDGSIEAAHNAVGQQGDTEAPAAEDNVEFHYVCICKNITTGHLLELDGRRKGPIDLGPLPEGEDVLGSKGLDVVRGFLAREGESGAFSIIALA